MFNITKKCVPNFAFLAVQKGFKYALAVIRSVNHINQSDVILLLYVRNQHLLYLRLKKLSDTDANINI